MYRAITSSDYKILMKADQAVYPTDNPVTPEIFNQWFKYNPEFGIIFEEDKKITGMLIIMPLSKSGWEGMLSGELEEPDIKGEHVFNPSKDKEIGFHGYHIEKYTDEDNFFEKAFGALYEITQKIAPKAEILGFSGYAVTTEGISLAYNKLNMREREYISNEHMVSKNGRLEVIDDLDNSKLERLIANGYIYHNRCKHLVTLPNEASLVWQFLR